MARCRSSVANASPFASLIGADGTGSAEGFGAVELARRGGCRYRELRALIEHGLVNKAVGRGRGALYFESHLNQLKAVVQAKETLGLSIPELCWVLDAETPGRLRREARAVERLVAAFDGRERVEEVPLEFGLHLTKTSVGSNHLKAGGQKIAASVAQALRAEADRVESIRHRLTIECRLRW